MTKDRRTRFWCASKVAGRAAGRLLGAFIVLLIVGPTHLPCTLITDPGACQICK